MTIPTVAESASPASLSQGLIPAPSPGAAGMRAPAVGFDFGSISTFPPEPQVGPEGGQLSPAVADRIQTQQGGGAPLEPTVQRRMEGALGHNFADVRIHADGESDTLSRSLSARAFTLGSDIFINQEATSAAAYGGDHLLAHELTHVVQQRGAGERGPLTVAPIDAPGEQEASAFAREMGTGNTTPAQMQPATRNHAVLQRVASAPAAPAAPAERADVAAQSAFNPMDRNHRLLRAIDQSETRITGMEGGAYIFKRHVDFAEAVAALSQLTAKQVQEVKDAYLAHEKRLLETDLFGPGESGPLTDLTEDQSAQIRALLGGTQAGAGASVEEQQAAGTHAASAKASELHALLKGDLEHEEIERVMGLLRQDATANAALIAAYGRLGADLRRDTWRMGVLEGQRAWKLLDGDSVGADAFKVGLERARISGIDERIAKLLNDMKENPYNATGAHIEIDDLGKERKKLVESIEQRAEQAGSKARVAAVLGDADALATAVGGTDAAVIRAVASDDPVKKVAAQLHKSAQAGTLTAEQLTAALRSLRTEAEERAKQSPPKGEPGVEAEVKRLADEYFGKLPDSYNSLIGSDDKKFDELVKDTGNEGDTTVNEALVQRHGKLDDVSELTLALSGDRKDTATIERVLRDKSAAAIAQLRVEYFARTGGHSLDFDLFGDAPTEAGEETGDFMGGKVKAGTLELVTEGKASGTSRLNLEDALQRPDTEGGPQEASYILARAEREYQYTIDNRGGTGWWRDHWGNEERGLLDETMEEVRRLFAQYCATVGWIAAFDPAGTNLQRPQMVHSTQATAIIEQMRLARATIRGDRAAYEKATAELRAMFEMAAAFVLQAAISALLTPAAGALLEAMELGADVVEASVMTARVAKFAASTSVNIASTVGANLAVYGNNYSVAMLKADLLGGLGASFGSEAVEKMLGPVSKGLIERLGPKCSAEIIALAKTAGSIEGGAWAQGSAGDLSLQNIVKTHLMGKAAGAITEATSSAVGLTPQPGSPKGTAPEEHTTPQERRPGGAGSDEPRRTSPVSAGQDAVVGSGAGPSAGSREPATPERLPSGPHSEEPSQTRLPATTETTTTDEGRPGVRSPSDEEKTLVDTKPIDEEQTLVDWEPDVVHELPDGSAILFDSPAEGRTLYNQSLREDSQREVAIYRNTRTGEVVVGQGSGNQVALDLKVMQESLPGPPGTWELEAHYHPINSETGVTPFPQRLPSSTNGDFSALEWESQQAGNQPRTSRIDIITEGDRRNYTEFRYDPNADRPYKIDYPDPVNGERTHVEFKTREAYEEWYGENFPGYRADIEATSPASPASGAAPTISAPDEIDEAIEGIRPVEEGGTVTSGAMTRGPADEMTGQMIEAVRELSQLNDEVRRLVQGEDTTPLPEVERSNREIERAQRILQDPNATPQEQLEAIRALIERAVAEFRADQQMGTKDPGEPYTLTARDLRGMCGGGRDISAEAIIALVGTSPHEVRIERIQAAHLGINTQHGFLVVTLADGSRFLVDPTFAQFADQIGGETYTAEPMLSSVEGSNMARDLLRDGVMPLTDDAMRQYVIGLGATSATADAATARLMSGGATLLTEIVRNGQVERFPGRPEGGFYSNLITVSSGDPTRSPVIALTNALDGKTENGKLVVQPLPPDHPLRPLLESLRARLEVLAATLPPLPEPPAPAR